MVKRVSVTATGRVLGFLAAGSVLVYAQMSVACRTLGPLADDVLIGMFSAVETMAVQAAVAMTAADGISALISDAALDSHGFQSPSHQAPANTSRTMAVAAQMMAQTVRARIMRPPVEFHAHQVRARPQCNYRKIR